MSTFYPIIFACNILVLLLSQRPRHISVIYLYCFTLVPDTYVKKKKIEMIYKYIK